MNSDSISRLTLSMFLRLTGYHIMSLIVTMSILAFLPDVSGNFIAQAINLGIIIVLPYLTMWKKGDTDCNKVAFGHMQADNLKGLKIGLIAYAPCMICGLLLIAAKFGALPSSYLSWYRVINAPFMPFNQSLMPTTLMFSEHSVAAVVVAGLTPVIEPLNLGLAYYFGLHRISFSETFGIFKKEKIRE